MRFLIVLDSVHCMLGFAEQKVIGGKLVKARVRFSDTLQTVSFFGDFFLHPEDTLLELEKSAVGFSIPPNPAELEKKFEAVLESNHAELVGATPLDLAQIVILAIQNGSNDD